MRPFTKTIKDLEFLRAKKSNKGCTADWFQPKLAMVFVSQVEPVSGGKYIGSLTTVVEVGAETTSVDSVEHPKAKNIKANKVSFFMIVGFMFI